MSKRCANIVHKDFNNNVSHLDLLHTNNKFALKPKRSRSDTTLGGINNNNRPYNEQPWPQSWITRVKCWFGYGTKEECYRRKRSASAPDRYNVETEEIIRRATEPLNLKIQQLENHIESLKKAHECACLTKPDFFTKPKRKCRKPNPYLTFYSNYCQKQPTDGAYLVQELIDEEPELKNINISAEDDKDARNIANRSRSPTPKRKSRRSSKSPQKSQNTKKKARTGRSKSSNRPTKSYAKSPRKSPPLPKQKVDTTPPKMQSTYLKQPCGCPPTPARNFGQCISRGKTPESVCKSKPRSRSLTACYTPPQNCGGPNKCVTTKSSRLRISSRDTKHCSINKTRPNCNSGQYSFSQNSMSKPKSCGTPYRADPYTCSLSGIGKSYKISKENDSLCKTLLSKYNTTLPGEISLGYNYKCSVGCPMDRSNSRKSISPASRNRSVSISSGYHKGMRSYEVPPNCAPRFEYKTRSLPRSKWFQNTDTHDCRGDISYSDKPQDKEPSKEVNLADAIYNPCVKISGPNSSVALFHALSKIDGVQKRNPPKKIQKKIKPPKPPFTLEVLEREILEFDQIKNTKDSGENKNNGALVFDDEYYTEIFQSKTKNDNSQYSNSRFRQSCQNNNSRNERFRFFRNFLNITPVQTGEDMIGDSDDRNDIAEDEGDENVDIQFHSNHEEDSFACSPKCDEESVEQNLDKWILGEFPEEENSPAANHGRSVRRKVSTPLVSTRKKASPLRTGQRKPSGTRVRKRSNVEVETVKRCIANTSSERTLGQRSPQRTSCYEGTYMGSQVYKEQSTRRNHEKIYPLRKHYSPKFLPDNASPDKVLESTEYANEMEHKGDKSKGDGKAKKKDKPCITYSYQKNKIKSPRCTMKKTGGQEFDSTDTNMDLSIPDQDPHVPVTQEEPTVETDVSKSQNIKKGTSFFTKFANMWSSKPATVDLNQKDKPNHLILEGKESSVDCKESSVDLKASSELDDEQLYSNYLSSDVCDPLCNVEHIESGKCDRHKVFEINNSTNHFKTSDSDEDDCFPKGNENHSSNYCFNHDRLMETNNSINNNNEITEGKSKVKGKDKIMNKQQPSSNFDFNPHIIMDHNMSNNYDDENKEGSSKDEGGGTNITELKHSTILNLPETNKSNNKDDDNTQASSKVKSEETITQLHQSSNSYLNNGSLIETNISSNNDDENKEGSSTVEDEEEKMIDSGIPISAPTCIPEPGVLSSKLASLNIQQILGGTGIKWTKVTADNIDIDADVANIRRAKEEFMKRHRAKMAGEVAQKNSGEAARITQALPFDLPVLAKKKVKPQVVADVVAEEINKDNDGNSVNGQLCEKNLHE